MKSRHSQGSISRYTTHSWKNSVEACIVTTISRFARAEYALHSEDFRKLNIFERKEGGKLDFVETMDRRNRLLLLSILRFYNFLEQSFFVSTLQSRCYDSSFEERVDNLNRYFFSSWSWLIIQMIEYSYFIQSRFMFSVCDDCLPGKISTWFYNCSSYSTFVSRRSKLYISKWHYAQKCTLTM